MAAPKKKPTSKKTPTQHKEPRYRSFKKAENPKPFFKFRFTQQTVYWLILGALILGLGAWVISLSVKVQRIYDRVGTDTTTSTLRSSDHAEHQ